MTKSDVLRIEHPCPEFESAANAVFAAFVATDVEELSTRLDELRFVGELLFGEVDDS